ncbi:MAG: helix-turn-helix transcriptional regulator [Oscillospiraceae bacterium]|nr:helix-turn-helix transcriptional regulator [Oscillospiraceae bacterium]
MNIKELRTEKKLSQAAFAKALGVSTSAIGAIEAGRMKVSAKIADKVKEVYGVVLAAEEKAEAAVVEAEKKVAEKKAAPKKAKAAPVKAEKKAAEKKPAVKAPAKKPAAKKAPAAEVIIQSPMGGEITPEAVIAKVGDVEKIYIRVDENKAYWVKGEETGSVDLW